jgi:hypothetical protein
MAAPNKIHEPVKKITIFYWFFFNAENQIGWFKMFILLPFGLPVQNFLPQAPGYFSAVI